MKRDCEGGVCPAGRRGVSRAAQTAGAPSSRVLGSTMQARGGGRYPSCIVDDLLFGRGEHVASSSRQRRGSRPSSSCHARGLPCVPRRAAQRLQGKSPELAGIRCTLNLPPVTMADQIRAPPPSTSWSAALYARSACPGGSARSPRLHGLAPWWGFRMSGMAGVARQDIKTLSIGARRVASHRPRAGSVTPRVLA